MRRAEDKITLLTLPSGLKIAHRQAKGAAVDYCGVIVHVGSRDDDATLPGMAHFVEHTIFKGTEKRQSWHILNRMERVGGELNAYTTKEETVVYTAAPAGNIQRAFELLGDLVTSSRFPDSELDKEREVVADEINSYLDSPSDAVFDDFEDIIFAGTPLGHNILGNTESISRINSLTCCQYLHQWYTTRNMTVFYYGSAAFDRVKANIERYFEALPTHEVKHFRLQPDFSPAIFNESKHIELHQAHTVMGCKIDGMYAPDRFTITLLTNILGGPGMNSLLNLALRERRGLVYSVEAATALMSDCGLFTIYFGCDPDDTERCKELVRTQLRDLAEQPMNERTLTGAKKQYLGQLAVASDNRESLAISTGRGAMHYGNVLTASQVIENINNITAEQISAAAGRLSDLSSLTLM